MLKSIKNFASEKINEWLGSEQGEIKCVVTFSPGTSHGKIFYIVLNGSNKPVLIAKVARNPQNTSRLLKEVKINATLREIGINVPKIYACEAINGTLVCFFEYINGKILNSFLTKDNFIELTRQVIELTARMRHASGKKSVPLTSELLHTQYIEPLRMLNNKFDEIQPVLNAFACWSDKILSFGLEFGFSHADFNPSNLILDQRSRLYVIDFEFASEEDITLNDILFFLATSNFKICGKPFRETVLNLNTNIVGTEFGIVLDQVLKANDKSNEATELIFLILLSRLTLQEYQLYCEDYDNNFIPFISKGGQTKDEIYRISSYYLKILSEYARNIAIKNKSICH